MKRDTLMKDLEVNTGPKSYRVLIVDDEDPIRMLLKSLLTRYGYQSEEVRDGLEALARIEKDAFDAVITDVEMPRVDGLRLVKTLHQTKVNLPILMITGYTKPSYRGRDRRGGKGFFKEALFY